VSEPAVRIALGSVYHPPDEAYPRLLVMRRWPRGVRKGAVDQWERDLGPSDALLDAYQSDAIDWDEFARRYRAEMGEQPGLLDWVARMAAGTGVTLLCGSHPDERCHRSLLADLVRERSAG
jgi:uncharacterized protein YeaO (DUF488 family)